MVRDLLNAVPEWALALAFIGAIVALALGAFRLVCHFLARWRDQGSVEGVLGLAAMVMTLFALVLAFVVVNLYSDYTSASSDVTDEANVLGAIVQDARAFPDADRLAVERAIARYTAEVRDHEFDTLAEGRSDPHANALVVGIVEALQAYAPQTETQKTFYGAATDQLNTFLAERENRVAKAETSIPWATARAPDLPVVHDGRRVHVRSHASRQPGRPHRGRGGRGRRIRAADRADPPVPVLGIHRGEQRPVHQGPAGGDQRRRLAGSP